MKWQKGNTDVQIKELKIKLKMGLGAIYVHICLIVHVSIYFFMAQFAMKA